jgi:hypothetical protein
MAAQLREWHGLATQGNSTRQDGLARHRELLGIGYPIVPAVRGTHSSIVSVSAGAGRPASVS